MAPAAQALLNIDFVTGPLMQRIGGRSKRAAKGFWRINCPLCTTRGERRPDMRQRGAVWIGADEVGIGCKNCDFRSRWKLGDRMSNGFREFLTGIGISETDVMRMNYRAEQLSRMMAPHAEALAPVVNAVPTGFATVDLPPGARSLAAWAEEGCEDPDFLAVAAYAMSRGEDAMRATTYYWSPQTRDGLHRRVVIPFRFDGRIVGWTARAVDPGVSPKYYAKEPSDFVFNNEALTRPGRKFVLVIEGAFDALAIDGVAVLGATISDRQAAWINGSGLRPILVADRDRAGARLIDVAVHHNWLVSFPRHVDARWWDTDVKDTADAVLRYGRLYTLRSVIECAVENKLRIQMLRKWLMRGTD